MDRAERYFKVLYVGQSNPLKVEIPLGYGSEIVDVEVETFFYNPGTATSVPTYIGLYVEGLRGRFNEKGEQIDTVKTFPYKGGVYDFDATGGMGEVDSENQYNVGLGNSLQVALIDQSAGTGVGINYTPIVTFNSYYTLNLTIWTK